jgi:hypothetical protein
MAWNSERRVSTKLSFFKPYDEDSPLLQLALKSSPVGAKN